jgi:hypothetical protein
MRAIRILGVVVVVSLVAVAAFTGCGSGAGTATSGAAGTGGAAGTAGTAGAAGAAGTAGTAGAAGAAGAAGSGSAVCTDGVSFTPNTSAACANCINQYCCAESIGCGADPTDYCDYCVSGIDAACSSDTPFENLESCISAHCTGCGVFF